MSFLETKLSFEKKVTFGEKNGQFWTMVNFGKLVKHESILENGQFWTLKNMSSNK
jgi:hypothetical protein